MSGEKAVLPLGNAKDRNDPIYSNDDDYEWDVSSKDIQMHRWRRVKGHNGAKAIGIAELKTRDGKIRKDYDSVEWVSQNSFYYFLRKIFLKKGINPEAEGRDFRKSITGSIADWCEEIGSTREDLKIYASSRAYLYWKGKRIPVSLETIEELAPLGTDIIIIEKQDIAELLHPYTDVVGIAILDTKGFVVQYARKLSKLARGDGCNIAILTDLDADGILMVIKVKQEIPSLFRIGINFKTLEHFQIDAAAAGESYSGKTMKSLNKMHLDEDVATAEELEFMRDMRVEIDSVITEVNDNKKFAEYIIETLVKKFETRNYNRATVVEDYAYPSVLWKLMAVLNRKSKPILEDRVDEIKAGLEEYKGVTKNVETDEADFAQELTNKLDDITERDEVTGAHQGEHLIAHPNYIRLVDGIQDLVDEFGTDEDEFEAEGD